MLTGLSQRAFSKLEIPRLELHVELGKPRRRAAPTMRIFAREGLLRSWHTAVPGEVDHASTLDPIATAPPLLATASTHGELSTRPRNTLFGKQIRRLHKHCHWRRNAARSGDPPATATSRSAPAAAGQPPDTLRVHRFLARVQICVVLPVSTDRRDFRAPERSNPIESCPSQHARAADRPRLCLRNARLLDCGGGGWAQSFCLFKRFRCWCCQVLNAEQGHLDRVVPVSNGQS